MRRLLPLFALLALLAAPTVAHASSFGAPVTLAPPQNKVVQEPVVAVSGSSVLAGWIQQRAGHEFGLVVRRGTTGGRFGRAETLTLRASQPALAADGRGGGAAIWETPGLHGKQAMIASIAPPGGRFDAGRTLAYDQAVFLDQTVLRAGDRYVVLWAQDVPGQSRREIRYAISNGAGRFGPVHEVVSAIYSAGGVRAAVAPDGTVTAVWNTPLENPQTSPAAYNTQLAYAQLAPGATAFGPATEIDAVQAAQGGEIASPAVAAGPGGTALTWQEQGALPELLQSASLGLGPASPTGTVFRVPSGDLGKDFGDGPALALPADGTPGLAAWAFVHGTGGESEITTAGEVYAAPRLADGGVGTPVTLSTGAIATQPQGAATAGDAIITWTLGSAPHDRLQYAVRPAGGTVSPAAALGSGTAQGAPALASSRRAVVAAWTANAGAHEHAIRLAIYEQRSQVSAAGRSRSGRAQT